MTNGYKTLFLSIAAAALLVSCDSGTPSVTNEAQELGQLPAEFMFEDYSRETQAGNYLAGQFAQYRQDWTMASRYLDKVIEKDPGNVELRQRAMILSMQSGDPAKAIAMARKVLEDDKKNLLALLFVSIDQISRAEFKAAANTLEDMPQNGIADFVRPILTAWSTAPTGRFAEENLINNSPLHAYHALLISDYIGKITDPERYFVNVLASGGADVHILEMMADVYARQGYKELADKIYDTLLSDKTQEYAGAYIQRLKAKRADHSLAQASKIETPEEGAAESFYNMARVLYQDQSDDSALVFARMATYMDPAKEDALILMAQIMIRNNHVDEAIALYKQVGKDSEEYAPAQRNIAQLFEEQGKPEEAVSFLDNIYANDKDINALIQIGDIYRRAEKDEQAIKAYNRAADELGKEIGPDYWHLLYARGMSYERSGNMKMAEQDLLKALEYRPDHPYLLNYLGYSWADQGKKLDKALGYVQRAVELRPDDGYILDSLGWVYFRMGQYEEAVVELEKAIELVPQDPTINDHLGDAFWQVGRRNEARFQWQRALNASKDPKMSAALESKISNGLTLKTEPVKQAEQTTGVTAPGKVVR